MTETISPATSLPNLKDEIADVLLYLARLADVLKIDLNVSVNQKSKTNALKYPIANSLSVSTKYNKK
jgi:NTP pyrophosphatase (non-canonical NTP hydrolase)